MLFYVAIYVKFNILTELYYQDGDTYEKPVQICMGCVYNI